jgi:biuret amidohydrolase
MTGDQFSDMATSRLAHSARAAADGEDSGAGCPLVLDPPKTAIVVTDMINHQLEPTRGMLAALTASGVDISYFVDRLETTVIPNHRRLLDAARALSAAVIFTAIGAVRADYSDLNPNVRDIGRWGARLGTWDTEIVAGLQQEGDIILPKSGSSSFHTSALDVYLRNMGITTVLYTGVITNGCVLASAVAGFDLGYRGYLVRDASATLSPHLQLVAEEVLALYTAGCVTTDEVSAALGSSPLRESGSPSEP